MRVRASRVLDHLRRQWMGALSLFLVLTGGVAYAANTIGSSDIIDGEVKTADLAANAVTSPKIADGQVTGADIGQAAVAGAELKNDAVTSQKVLNETLVGNDVVDNTLKGADIDESTLSSIGGGGPAGGDLIGSYPNPLIRDGSIGSRHLKNLVQANDSEMIAPGGVSDDVRAVCPEGLAIAGGGYWDFPSGQLSGVRHLPQAVLAEGTNRGTAPQVLHAFAFCLEI